MEQLIAAAAALVERFKETTAVHDEVAALETALAGLQSAETAQPAETTQPAE